MKYNQKKTNGKRISFIVICFFKWANISEFYVFGIAQFLPVQINMMVLLANDSERHAVCSVYCVYGINGSMLFFSIFPLSLYHTSFRNSFAFNKWMRWCRSSFLAVFIIIGNFANTTAAAVYGTLQSISNDLLLVVAAEFDHFWWCWQMQTILKLIVAHFAVKWIHLMLKQSEIVSVPFFYCIG